jgi:hypothetical protein
MTELKASTGRMPLVYSGVLGLYIVGSIVTWGLVSWLNPGGPGMGVSLSSERQLWSLVVALAFQVPASLWFWKLQYDDQRWRAEFIGVTYEEGKKYPFLVTKRIILWGLAAALFVAIGSVPFTLFDIGALVIAFISVLWGPLDVAVISIITWMIRGPFAYGESIPMALVDGLSDTLAWGWICFVAQRFIRPWVMKDKKRVIPAIAIFVAAWFTGYNMWLMSSFRFRHPDPAMLAEMLGAYLAWYPTAAIAGTVGFLFAMATSRYVWGKSKPSSRNIYDWIGLALGIVTFIQNISIIIIAMYAL